MKIAMLCPRTPRENASGIENYVLNVSKKLTRDGFTVEIFTTAKKPKKDYKINNILLHEFNAFSPGEAYYFSYDLYKALKKTDANIIHCNGFNNLTTISGILAKKPNQKLVITMNSSGPSSIFRKMLWFPYLFLFNCLAKKIDKIICVSEFEYNYFIKRIKLPKERFTIIPNGVDKEFIESIKVNKKKDTIISIGRLVKNKGFHHLLRAFQLISREKTELTLNIIGSGSYEKKLKKLTKDLNIENKVHFLGHYPFNMRREFIKKLKEASLFVFLSSYESQGIVVSESICAKVPVIVAYNSALAEFVDKGYAVGIKHPENTKEVAEKIKMVLDRPDQFIPKNPKIMSWSEVGEQIIKIYEKISQSS